MMSYGKKGPRQILAFVCSVCKTQNYITEKNKTNTPDKLVLKNIVQSVKRKQTIKKKVN